MTRSFGDECASRVGVNAEPGKYLSISCKIYYVKNKILIFLFFRNFGA
jgi:hypothetical protein